MAQFTLDGTIEVAFVTTEPASLAAPTAAEIAAGVDVVGSDQNEQLNEIEGFEEQPTVLPVEGYDSNLVGTVSGQQTVPESKLTFVKDTTVETIWSALSKGTTGWLIFMPYGDSTGSFCRTFAVTVSSRVPRWGRNVVHLYDVNFAPGVPVDGAVAA